MASNNIFEHGNVVSILYPSDMQTAVADDWIHLGDYHALDIIFFKGVGTAADDPDIHVTQATSNAGAGEKALNFDTYYLKQGTLLSTSSVGGQFTKTTMTSSYIISFDATSAEEQMICGIHIEADMLDVSGGFEYVRASVPDVGSNAQLGCILGVLHPSRYKQEQTPNPLD
jgi:hypothetical protein